MFATIAHSNPATQPNSAEYVEALMQNILHSHGNNTLIINAVDHHLNAGGSRSRARLTYDIACAFTSLSSQEAGYLACAPELLHNASLIHDDVHDQDTMRRNTSSVWQEYGTDIAICAGDYLISAAYGALGHISKNTPQLLQKTHECVTKVIAGQINDITQDKMHSLDDIKTYEHISAGKSGPLIAMCASLPLIAANRAEYVAAAETALHHFAVSYQIFDDINDIEQDQKKRGVNAAVNIVTIMQKNQSQGPIMAAAELALSHLDSATKHAAELPNPVYTILQKEIEGMAQKIKLISVN